MVKVLVVYISILVPFFGGKLFCFIPFLVFVVVFNENYEKPFPLHCRFLNSGLIIEIARESLGRNTMFAEGKKLLEKIPTLLNFRKKDN